MIQTNRLKRSCRFPSHRILREFCRRIDGVNVLGAARLEIEGSLAFSNVLTTSSTLWPRPVPRLTAKHFGCPKCCRAETCPAFHDVHVVAYARSVRRVVVVTPNMQPFAAPDGHGLGGLWFSIFCKAGFRRNGQLYPHGGRKDPPRRRKIYHPRHGVSYRCLIGSTEVGW